jgi:hypothetical protein
VLEQNEEWEAQKSRMATLAIGITAMFAYAVAMGIVRFNFTRTDIEITEKALDLD